MDLISLVMAWLFDCLSFWQMEEHIQITTKSSFVQVNMC